MKMLFTALAAACVITGAGAQTNNPFDQSGRDFVKSVQVVFSELKSGNVKAADEATIKKIQALVPSKTQMNPELAGQVINKVKTDPLPLAAMLTHAPFKPDVQREISLMVEHSFTSDDNSHKEWIKQKVESLQKASFGQDEKEMLLTLLAIQYHLDELNNLGRIRCNTTINGEVVKEAEGMDCAGAAVVVGFTIGYTFCGFYCGVGGAVLGFVTVLAGEIS